MKMKLIASLLVLCLTFSIGSALAQTNNSTNATNPNATCTEGIILISGKVIGNVTITGHAYNYNGPMFIIRDTIHNTDHITLTNPVIGSGPTILNTDTLTPLQVNRAASKTTFAQSNGPFGLMLAKDFKCKMTAKSAATQGEVALELSTASTADEISLFGSANDINNLFNTVQEPKISMTEVTTVIL